MLWQNDKWPFLENNFVDKADDQDVRPSLERWLSLEGVLSEDSRQKLLGAIHDDRGNGDTSIICIIAMIFQEFADNLARFPRKT